jgi:hypothetical protein
MALAIRARACQGGSLARRDAAEERHADRRAAALRPMSNEKRLALMPLAAVTVAPATSIPLDSASYEEIPEKYYRGIELTKLH